MHIGILATGAPPGDLAAAHGDYTVMTARLLGVSHRYTTYAVATGDLPRSHTACDAYLVTGSAAGVNDDLPWIEPLAMLLRAVRGRVPLIGICFGHQIIAHAFGGRIERAAQGWGLGLHRYALARPVAGLGSEVAAIASHQDQVVLPPETSRVIAASAFTPNAALAYADGDALTMQFHPEFDQDYAAALIAAHNAPDIGRSLREQAIASLDGPNDNLAMGLWLNRYLSTGTIA